MAAVRPCVAPDVPEGASLAERLDLFVDACGVLLVTRDDGLHALTPELAPIATITGKAVRWVQARRQGEARELYYFAADAPDLIKLDLRTGREQVLVKLPRLKNHCFTGAEPGEKVAPADPVEFIQSSADIDLDPDAGVLCLDLGDRNENMASIALNMRADLRTRKVEQRTVMVDESCAQGPAREQERACQTTAKREPRAIEVAALGGQPGLVSPTGYWVLYLDDTFIQSSDYVYTAAFLYDARSGLTQAITPTGLVPFDRAKRDAAKGPPEGTCALPGEASPRWVPGHDVLLVDGCGPAGDLLITPPGLVRKIEGQRVTTYP